MDALDVVIEEHATLRRLAAKLPALLGPQRGVGWDDVSGCDLAAFRAAQDELLEALTTHELREERVFSERLPQENRAELQGEVERAHEQLNGLVSLLRSLSAACAGGRVHALRVTAARVGEELERHLFFEEKILIPLLKRGRT
jgi:hypothetical protein